MTKAYGLYHRMGMDAINIAHPATLVIDRDRKSERTSIAATVRRIGRRSIRCGGGRGSYQFRVQIATTRCHEIDQE